jgi:hypothetical protein
MSRGFIQRSQNKISLITDMRHELEHDKPEPHHDDSKERVDALLKWHRRLVPVVGKEALLWQPLIRPGGERVGFTIGGEPIIMKFMKYPVAKWVADTTREITNGVSDMMMRHTGKKLVADKRVIDARCHGPNADDIVRRLWQAGE